MFLQAMTRHRRTRRAAAAAIPVALAAAFVALGTPAAYASPSTPAPNPGSPGSQYFPTMSPGTFAMPPAAARVKFRWWQPVADTSNAEIQREVATMAGNFGGGFEQNGFPVGANCDGCTQQFLTFASSQQFGQQYGWGSPLWSQRTQTYQQAAAQDNVIGDMNQGSQWDNNAPDVYSPNQPADAQDLSYGVQQYQPGQAPGGELPPVTAPALGGESTTLSATANPGDSTVQLQSIAGLLEGDQITLGRGSAAETETIKNVGTASPAVQLSQPASAGATVLHVPPAGSTTGVPGTAQLPAQFVAGEHVTIGSGATAEKDVIASVGTYDMATTPTTIALPPGGSGAIAAPAGATNVEVASTANFLKGDTITIGTGAAAESRTITSVGGAGSGTTLSAAADAGALQVTVSSPAGLRAGQYITIGQGGSQGPDRIATISGSTLTLYSPLKSAHASGDPLALKSVGLTFTPALTRDHTVGESAIDTGTGITLKTALANAHLAGDTFIAPGTGVTLTAPLTKMHLAGANNAIQTTLAAAATAGATNVKVASLTNLVPGDQLTLGQPGYTQTVTITSVGTSGANGTGVTFAPALSQWHYAGDPVANASSANVTNATGGMSDIEKESLVAAELVQCLPPSTADTEVAQTTALSGPATAGDTTITAGPPSYSGNPGADWIWNTPGSAGNAAAGTIYVRKTFTTPAGVTAAQLRINADDAEVTYVNGVQVASSSYPNWPISQNADITKDLNPAGQENVIAVAATNASQGSGGVIAAVQINGSSPARIVTDPSWKAWPDASTPPASDWNTAGYDDSSWENAFSAGAYGIGPWGTQPDGTVPTLSVGDEVTVGAGSAAETRTITSISGSTLTLDKALSSAHPASDGVWDTCSAAPTHNTRELDPSTTINVTKDVTPNALNWTEGSLHYTGGALPAGNGQPWELIDFYLHGDTQNKTGATATTPNQWLGHLSVASAKAMTDYFDNHILDNPATKAAIAYQDAHTGKPAVFEDSLENANNLNWVPDMISSWQGDLDYNPTSLLPALAATGRNATGKPAFDFPQSDGQGATLGWRVRDDYGQMWNDLYINQYVKTLDSWASAHGLVARLQPYGDPIDAGEAAANIGLVETEHLELAGVDESQQFKVVASGTYQDASPHLLSNECCEAGGQVWADPFGIDGTGNGTSPDATEPNAESVYADQAGGDSQIIYHGWPYAIGAAGSPALWPGNTYGGDTRYAAANGPNQPQFADDRINNINVARHDVVLRQGQPAFDVAVLHEDFGLGSQGQDNVTSGWDLGTVTTPGGSYTPTSGKLLRSSSSLSQAGYLYGYVSPAFFRYPTATFATDPNNPEHGAKTLFPGHGDYRSLVLYDQSVLPVDVAQKIAALAGHGLPIVIIGQVPNAAPNASGGTLAGMQAADAQVRTAMAKVTASPDTKVVPDSTAAGSQSADANAPVALKSVGIDPATQMNTPSADDSSGTATPVLGIARHAQNVDYYQLFNTSSTTTVHPSVTLTGTGTPYLLNTWTGAVTPIANYAETGGRVTLSLRIGPADAVDVAITPANPFQAAPPDGGLHATGTTANATGEAVDNVVYDSSGSLAARASATGTYTTTLSNDKTVTSNITVPSVDQGPSVSVINGMPTLTKWQLSVDSWTQTPSGDPTQTLHTPIPASGTFTVEPASGVTDGSLPSWTQITPQNVPGLDPGDNLTNVAGIGAYTTSFTLPAGWSAATAGAYLNVGAAVDTVDIWVNGKAVSGVDENDRNQIDIGPYLRAGSNTLKITVATPLRNAVAVAPSTPATGQVPSSAEAIGSLQGGPKLPSVGLLGPVTLTPYGQDNLGQ